MPSSEHWRLGTLCDDRRYHLKTWRSLLKHSQSDNYRGYNSPQTKYCKWSDIGIEIPLASSSLLSISSLTRHVKQSRAAISIKSTLPASFNIDNQIRTKATLIRVMKKCIAKNNNWLRTPGSDHESNKKNKRAPLRRLCWFLCPSNNVDDRHKYHLCEANKDW